MPRLELLQVETHQRPGVTRVWESELGPKTSITMLFGVDRNEIMLIIIYGNRYYSVSDAEANRRKSIEGVNVEISIELVECSEGEFQH